MSDHRKPTMEGTNDLRLNARVNRCGLGILTSAALHVVVLLGACYVQTPASWEYRVARGKPLTLTAVLSPSETQSSAEFSIQSPASPVVLEIRPDDPLVRKHPAGELVQSTPEVVNFAVERTAEVQPTVLRPHEWNHDQELPIVHDLVTPPFRHKKAPPTATMAIGAPTPVEVSSDPIGALFDSPPTKLPENAAPVYPPEAQRTGRQGRVVLAVTVNESGNVDRVRVYRTSGHSDLDRVAIEAVENWRFRPATLRDTRVLAEVLIPIKFAIR